MSSDFVHRPLDFVGVPSTTIVYVGVADRAAFDRIDAVCSDVTHADGERVLAKCVDNGTVRVFFQHWLRLLTTEAWIRRRREADQQEADVDRFENEGGTIRERRRA